MAENPNEAQAEDLLLHLLEQAEGAGKAGDPERAAALLSEAALLDPGNEAVGERLFSLAQDLFFEREYSRALLLFNLLRALWDEDSLVEYPYSLFYAGWSLIELGVPQAGEALLRQGLALDPENPQFLRSLGYYLLNLKRYDEGIQYLEKGLEEEDDEQEILESLEAIAWALFKQHRQTDALEYLLDYCYLFGDERVPELYLRFVRLLEDQTAIEALDRLREKLAELEAEGLIDVPEQTLVKIQVESFWRYFSQLEGALRKQGSEAKDEAPRDFRQKILNLTMEFANQSARVDPANPLPQLMRAKVLLNLEDFPAALEAAERGLAQAVKGYPASVREEPETYRAGPFSAPGLQVTGMGQSQLKDDPAPGLFLAKADALTGLGRLDEALMVVTQAQALYPSEIIFYRYAAALLLKLDKPAGALAHLQAARKAKIKFDPPTRELEKKIKAILAQDKQS